MLGALESVLPYQTQTQSRNLHSKKKEPFLSTVLLSKPTLPSSHPNFQHSPFHTHPSALTRTSTSTTMRWWWHKTSSKTPSKAPYTTIADDQLSTFSSAPTLINGTATTSPSTNNATISTDSSGPLIWRCCRCRRQREYKHPSLLRTKCQYIYTSRERRILRNCGEGVRSVCDHLGPCDDCYWCIPLQDPRYMRKLIQVYLGTLASGGWESEG